MKISVSKGNSKMGAIPSVSLPPVVTCAKGCPCAKKCYAMKLCRIYPSVRKAYQRNLDILTADPVSYWEQVSEQMKMTRFFRFHVSGDIVSYMYFSMLVGAVEKNPHCETLVFTKRFDIVNRWIDDNGELPENLHLIFSDWIGLDVPNPHKLPLAHVIFKGEEPHDDWKICGGNCSECACRGVGCWELKRGEHIAFYEH